MRQAGLGLYSDIQSEQAGLKLADLKKHMFKMRETEARKNKKNLKRMQVAWTKLNKTRIKMIPYPISFMNCKF